MFDNNIRNLFNSLSGVSPKTVLLFAGTMAMINMPNRSGRVGKYRSGALFFSILATICAEPFNIRHAWQYRACVFLAHVCSLIVLTDDISEVFKQGGEMQYALSF